MHKKEGSLNKFKKKLLKTYKHGWVWNDAKNLKKAHVQNTHIVYVFVYGKIAINK